MLLGVLPPLVRASAGGALAYLSADWRFERAPRAASAPIEIRVVLELPSVAACGARILGARPQMAAAARRRTCVGPLARNPARWASALGSALFGGGVSGSARRRFWVCCRRS